MKMEIGSFEDARLVKPENRAKLCYAFMTAKGLYHQEVRIHNPHPTQYDPQYVFPRDVFLYTYNCDSDGELLPMADFTRLTQKALAEGATISCVGSHIPNEDRTVQIFCLPEGNNDFLGKSALIQFLMPLSKAEKNSIIESVMAKFKVLIQSR